MVAILTVAVFLYFFAKLEPERESKRARSPLNIQGSTEDMENERLPLIQSSPSNRSSFSTSFKLNSNQKNIRKSVQGVVARCSSVTSDQRSQSGLLSPVTDGSPQRSRRSSTNISPETKELFLQCPECDNRFSGKM